MYESNYQVLTRICEEKSVIRHVSRHRNPDGSLDIAGNLKIWNDAIAQFDQIPLWENGAPNGEGRPQWKKYAEAFDICQLCNDTHMIPREQLEKYHYFYDKLTRENFVLSLFSLLRFTPKG